jgi:hypothetical protein
MLLNAEETRRHVLALLDDDRQVQPVPSVRTKQITDYDGPSSAKPLRSQHPGAIRLTRRRTDAIRSGSTDTERPTP